jgi:hypothetical protein
MLLNEMMIFGQNEAISHKKKSNHLNDIVLVHGQKNTSSSPSR